MNTHRCENCGCALGSWGLNDRLVGRLICEKCFCNLVRLSQWLDRVKARRKSRDLAPATISTDDSEETVITAAISSDAGLKPAPAAASKRQILKSTPAQISPAKSADAPAQNMIQPIKSMPIEGPPLFYQPPVAKRCTPDNDARR